MGCLEESTFGRCIVDALFIAGNFSLRVAQPREQFDRPSGIFRAFIKARDLLLNLAFARLESGRTPSDNAIDRHIVLILGL